MTPTRDIAGLLRLATDRLAKAGIDGPAREARLLLEHAAAIPLATQIAFGERVVADEAVVAFERAVSRRVDREPLSHIIGRREFWSLDFQVNRDTLDPRPDSETLIDGVLHALAIDADYRSRPFSLIDFGTGTGCLLLALLSELPMAQGLGIDLNPGAVAMATANAERLGMAKRASFRQGDWDQGLSARFDVILSNPPYIPSAEIEDLAPEVARHDPRLALDGGVDGLDAYRALAQTVIRVKKPDSLIAFEIGYGQAAAVTEIMAAAGLRREAVAADLQGHERVLLFR